MTRTDIDTKVSQNGSAKFTVFDLRMKLKTKNRPIAMLNRRIRTIAGMCDRSEFVTYFAYPVTVTHPDNRILLDLIEK